MNKKIFIVDIKNIDFLKNEFYNMSIKGQNDKSKWLSLCPFLFWSEGHALLFIYYIYKEYLFNNFINPK